jgi:hypothetical protein
MANKVKRRKRRVCVSWVTRSHALGPLMKLNPKYRSTYKNGTPKSTQQHLLALGRAVLKDRRAGGVKGSRRQTNRKKRVNFFAG